GATRSPPRDSPETEPGPDQNEVRPWICSVSPPEPGASPGGSRTPGWHAGNKKKGVHGGNMVSPMCRPTVFLRLFHAETPEPHRSAGTRYRPPPRRPVA